MEEAVCFCRKSQNSFDKLISVFTKEAGIITETGFILVFNIAQTKKTSLHTEKICKKKHCSNSYSSSFGQ